MGDLIEKRPGHENLMAAAKAITEAPLGRLTDKEKEALGYALLFQVMARRDDFIPERVRADVVGEVVRAGTTISSLLDPTIMEFANSNLGEGKWQNIISDLPETWVTFTCTYGAGMYTCTKEYFDQLVARTMEDRTRRPWELLQSVLGPLALIESPLLPRLIWRSDGTIVNPDPVGTADPCDGGNLEA